MYTDPLTGGSVMDAKTKFDMLAKLMKERIPGFEIRYKTDSLLMKVINVIVYLFCPTFMTRFTTTFYPYVYFPSKETVEADYDTYFGVLAHEYVHLYDSNGNWWHRLKFSVRFLAPQIYALPFLLSLLAIGAVWNKWMLLSLAFLLFLLFLIPWRSKGRTEIEFHGYSMSYAVLYWLHGKVDPIYLNFFVGQFTSWNYYRMWPNETEMRQRFYELQRNLARGITGVATMDQPFVDVHEIIKTRLPPTQ
jgi:hypothetical protein